MSILSRIAGMIGNLLEHYDTALFGLVSPFLAPLFFPEQEPLTALILTYAILPLGLFVRPLGAIFFGWLTDILGSRKALFYSLFGTAIATISIGLLPTYEKIGIGAPIFLALLRSLQGFFAAGESMGGIVFLLERTKTKNNTLLSSFYDVTSIGGGLIASFLVSFFCKEEGMSYAWRFLFLAGGSTALIGLIIRFANKEEVKEVSKPIYYPIWSLLKKHRRAIAYIAIASGFSHITYSFAFTFMNGFVPLITSFSKTQMLEANTKLLIWDICLLPTFGYISYKIGKEKVMLFGALGSAALAFPLFSLLEKDSSLDTLFFIRGTIVFLGTAFAAPYYAWAIQQVPSQHRCLILALGANIGSQLLAAPSQSLCLWLYKITNNTTAPSIYFILLGGLTSYVVIRSIYRSKTELA